jgi:hypothetical protein
VTLLIRKLQAPNPGRKPEIMREILVIFLSVHTNAELRSNLGHNRLLPRPSTHYSIIIKLFDAIHAELLAALLLAP